MKKKKPNRFPTVSQPLELILKNPNIYKTQTKYIIQIYWVISNPPLFDDGGLNKCSAHI